MRSDPKVMPPIYFHETKIDVEITIWAIFFLAKTQKT